MSASKWLWYTTQKHGSTSDNEESECHTYMWNATSKIYVHGIWLIKTSWSNAGDWIETLWYLKISFRLLLQKHVCSWGIASGFAGLSREPENLFCCPMYVDYKEYGKSVLEKGYTRLLLFNILTFLSEIDCKNLNTSKFLWDCDTLR